MKALAKVAKVCLSFELILVEPQEFSEKQRSLFNLNI